MPFVTINPGNFHHAQPRRDRDRPVLQDPPEYYDPPGGFLAFDIDVSDLLLTAAPATSSKQLDNFEGHFRLVNHQLKAVSCSPFTGNPACLELSAGCESRRRQQGV